ncbi:MAG: hypothetical protein V1723_01990 [Candidatus Uhrbacteria bacterium]
MQHRLRGLRRANVEWLRAEPEYGRIPLWCVRKLLRGPDGVRLVGAWDAYMHRWRVRVFVLQWVRELRQRHREWLRDRYEHQRGSLWFMHERLRDSSERHTQMFERFLRVLLLMASPEL